MGRKRDKFWEYVDSENKCKFCGQKIPGASRIKYHLAQVPGGGISKCDKVEDGVKAEAGLALNNSNKRVKQSTTSNDVEENNMNANLASSSTRGEMEVDLLPTTDLVGEQFPRYMDKILGWLMGDEVSIMGVWGMGGVGKTALLKNIRNKLLNNNHHVIWIPDSQNHSIPELRRAIAMSIDKNISKNVDDVKIARLFRALEKMIKCTLILDDVGYDISLEDVGIPLRNDGIPLRIIVASRLLDVCKSMGCKDNIVQVETLEGYGEDFDLFSKSLGDDVTLTKDMRDIARELAWECGGLPLAIIAIARSMRGKTDIREWRTTLSKLERREMDQHDIKQRVFPVLKSSYDRLNDTTLQDCFLSLSLYFEDHYEFQREDLIRNFIVEGLIDERQCYEEKFDEGHSILNKLINNSLLVERGANAIRLHKLVRAMAVNVGKESHGYRAEFPDEREWKEDLQKISLSPYKVAEISFGMSPKCPKLTTLRMFGGFKEITNNFGGFKEIPDDFFMNMPALKILDLSRNSRIEVLPLSISNLECLTVLLLGSCESLRFIPSLAKLRQLKRLDLSNTAVTQVPLGFENLTNLRWLHLNRTAVMKAEHLEKLPMLQSIGATFVDKDEFNACIEIIQNIIDSDMMRGYFLGLIGDFYDYDDDDDFPYNIDSDKVIEIEGVEHCELQLPSNIDKLKIKDCNQWRKSLCDVLSIQRGYNSLHISKCTVSCCDELEYLFCSSGRCILCSSLQSLNELHLFCLGSLSMLYKENELASEFLPFSHLTKLSISDCNGMKKLFSAVMSTELHNLEKISVRNCELMEEIFSREKRTSGDVLLSFLPCVPYEVNLDEFYDEAINLPKLKSVSLLCLPQLTSVCKGIIECSSLEEFTIDNCPKLECVPQTQPPFEIQVR